jgi:hypothetical protein
MFWFLFWVGLSVGVLSFGFFMAIIIHRGNMKALEILRSYAEKGIEPPPAILELLTRQIGDAEAAEARRKGRKAGNFTGLLVASCVGGGIAWWRMNEGGPQWVVYFFAASAVFFGIRAITYLFTAFTTSEK